MITLLHVFSAFAVFVLIGCAAIAILEHINRRPEDDYPDDIEDDQ